MSVGAVQAIAHGAVALALVVAFVVTRDVHALEGVALYLGGAGVSGAVRKVLGR